VTGSVLGIDVHVTGREHAAGPALFVVNHVSVIDLIAVPQAVPHKIRTVAKKELMRVPVWGKAWAEVGGIVIDRADPDSAKKVIDAGLAALPPGYSVVVFPEGTRSRNGEIKKFKKGFAHMAMSAGLPVVPIGTSGCLETVGRRGILPIPGPVEVSVGPPIDTTSWSPSTLDAHVEVTYERVTELVAKSKARRAARFGTG